MADYGGPCPRVWSCVRVVAAAACSCCRSVEAEEWHSKVGCPEFADLHRVAGLDHLAVADVHGYMTLPHDQVAGLKLIRRDSGSDGLGGGGAGQLYACLSVGPLGKS